MFQEEQIQASIKKFFVKRYKNLLYEGTCYIITNFGVVTNDSKYRYTRHPYKINFLANMKIEELATDTICQYGLNFSSFNTILVKADETYIIGKIVTHTLNTRYLLLLDIIC